MFEVQKVPIVKETRIRVVNPNFLKKVSLTNQEQTRKVANRIHTDCALTPKARATNTNKRRVFSLNLGSFKSILEKIREDKKIKKCEVVSRMARTDHRI